ncbi:hypothetical protein TIFTF001_034370 [Ficus carica]|uniref:Uncharacterized protein n=1 Tax=Ficus carica TaxID=3494 RepID=A0AA88E037_FICCA|nr:hypothetical protein TIFTF001_034370 [Ficus carica]
MASTSKKAENGSGKSARLTEGLRACEIRVRRHLCKSHHASNGLKRRQASLTLQLPKSRPSVSLPRTRARS